VDNILTNSLLPDISRKILGGMAEGEKMTAIHVGIGDTGDFVYALPGAQVAVETMA
jgi:type VI secretion system protein VasG